MAASCWEGCRERLSQVGEDDEGQIVESNSSSSSDTVSLTPGNWKLIFAKKLKDIDRFFDDISNIQKCSFSQEQENNLIVLKFLICPGLGLSARGFHVSEQILVSLNQNPKPNHTSESNDDVATELLQALESHPLHEKPHLMVDLIIKRSELLEKCWTLDSVDWLDMIQIRLPGFPKGMDLNEYLEKHDADSALDVNDQQDVIDDQYLNFNLPRFLEARVNNMMRQHNFDKQNLLSLNQVLSAYLAIFEEAIQHGLGSSIKDADDFEFELPGQNNTVTLQTSHSQTQSHSTSTSNDQNHSTNVLPGPIISKLNSSILTDFLIKSQNRKRKAEEANNDQNTQVDSEGKENLPPGQKTAKRRSLGSMIARSPIMTVENTKEFAVKYGQNTNTASLNTNDHTVKLNAVVTESINHNTSSDGNTNAQIQATMSTVSPKMVFNYPSFSSFTKLGTNKKNKLYPDLAPASAPSQLDSIGNALSAISNLDIISKIQKGNKTPTNSINSNTTSGNATALMATQSQTQTQKPQQTISIQSQTKPNQNHSFLLSSTHSGLSTALPSGSTSLANSKLSSQTGSKVASKEHVNHHVSNNVFSSVPGGSGMQLGNYKQSIISQMASMNQNQNPLVQKANINPTPTSLSTSSTVTNANRNTIGFIHKAPQVSQQGSTVLTNRPRLPYRLSPINENHIHVTTSQNTRNHNVTNTNILKTLGVGGPSPFLKKR